MSADENKIHWLWSPAKSIPSNPNGTKPVVADVATTNVLKVIILIVEVVSSQWPFMSLWSFSANNPQSDQGCLILRSGLDIFQILLIMISVGFL